MYPYFVLELHEGPYYGLTVMNPSAMPMEEESAHCCGHSFRAMLETTMTTWLAEGPTVLSAKKTAILLGT
jgi:hypothetical protein